MHTLPAIAVPASCATSSQAELALTLLGPSPAMSSLWSQLRRLAPHMRTLLLTGPPDSGQEAVARLLLDLSAQPRRVFLSLPASEADEQLHRAQSPGGFPPDVFLFLPDADRLSPEAQGNVLRLLRSRRPHTLAIVAAATAEDLRSLVSLGRFAPELAEALHAVRVAIPPLKQRAEDVPMLLQQMIQHRCRTADRTAPQIAEEVLRAAMQHPWTGNLRELSEVANELIHRSPRKGELSLAEWASAVKVQRTPDPVATPVRLLKLEAVIQEHIYAVLRACSGNKQRAAEVLGISRSTLYRTLEDAEEKTLALAS